MSLLYLRTWAIEAGKPGSQGLRFEDIDLTFTVRMNGRSKPTLTDVTVFNPSDELIGLLGQSGTIVRVLAGYEEDGAAEVGQGTIVKDSLDDLKLSADPRVSFQLTNAGRVLANTTISKSWRTVRASEVIEYIRQQMGLTPDVIIFAKDPLFSRGYVASGSPGLALASLVADCGCQYTIVDGRLRIWPKGQIARQKKDVWAEDTGLLEAQRSSDGKTIRARALLRPGLRVGDTLQIESPVHNGNVVVQSGAHDGDTTSDSWYTSIVGAPIG